jgi:hypothetical protein
MANKSFWYVVNTPIFLNQYKKNIQLTLKYGHLKFIRDMKLSPWPTYKHITSPQRVLERLTTASESHPGMIRHVKSRGMKQGHESSQGNDNTKYSGKNTSSKECLYCCLISLSVAPCLL